MDQTSQNERVPERNHDLLTLQSDSINELATALAKAQGDIQAASKDRINPHFKSKYADLASIWDACRGPLSKNGLAIVQQPLQTARGTVIVTNLIHASGQWMRSILPVNPTKNDPQGMGSAITYMRRYALSAMVGVAPDEDDDGNAASSRPAGEISQSKPASPGKARSEEEMTPHQKLLKKTSEEIREAMSKAGSVQAINKVWSDYQDVLGDVRDSNPRTYDFLEDIYQKYLGKLAQAPEPKDEQQAA